MYFNEFEYNLVLFSLIIIIWIVLYHDLKKSHKEINDRLEKLEEKISKSINKSEKE
ncbi:MAG: hypothetical protein Q4B52_01815 [Tissierellia bacterium]|nr:hypothetical protein [Tissierellia bacterium]